MKLFLRLENDLGDRMKHKLGRETRFWQRRRLSSRPSGLWYRVAVGPVGRQRFGRQCCLHLQGEVVSYRITTLRSIPEDHDLKQVKTISSNKEW